MNRFVTLTAACALGASTAAQSGPPQARDEPEPVAGPGAKIVCKTFTRIGTLASRYRTCKTKAEWERERDNLRQFNVTDSCRTRHGGMPGSPVPGSPGTYDC